ncbi:CYTH domain-containing protein [Salipiger sp. 1_MG-2023]|uniref:CYTH domain-containing protein n=1 Tax=Salipiger sp. 1_MG-2023 TaxID=3062665 RepID=UPI0026E38E49|nr:CYTH domain-containing protein [Salipiger sp. 1_MG-2023]MDO6584027.1 CYTH domain-containing protein [Salipiger sp. 1_MG-2023]
MSQPAVEIERKFLVATLPDLSGVQSDRIRQGYLTQPQDSVQVRLRARGARHFLTVKGPGLMVRSEHETEIPEEAFAALWPATEGRRLCKTRWTGHLPCGARYELDLFDDRPLRLVEVEFDSEAAARRFAPPDWFGAEVTGDPAYANSTLATGGPVPG